MNEELIIRPFESKDHPQVVKLVRTIQDREFGVPISLEQQPDLIDPIKFFRHDGGDFWVALKGDTVIGSIGLLVPKSSFGVVRKMFVEKSHRGLPFVGKWSKTPTSAAQHLLNALMGHAQSLNIRLMTLGTTEMFKAAHRFYERNGFSQVDLDKLPPEFPRVNVDTRFYQRQV